MLCHVYVYVMLLVHAFVGYTGGWVDEDVGMFASRLGGLNDARESVEVRRTSAEPCTAVSHDAKISRRVPNRMS